MASTSRLGRLLPLLLLFVPLAAAAVLPEDASYDFPLRPRQGEIPDLVSCTESCDLNTCGGGSCRAPSALSRRSLGLGDLPESFTQLNISADGLGNNLAKRLFRYDPNSNTYTGDRNPTTAEVDHYLPAVFNHGEDAYFGEPLPLVYDIGPNQQDERAYSQQVELRDRPFQIISGGLHGCTVVVLVSRRAVWMAHFWESYSHGQPNRDEPTLEPAFVDRVLKHLRGETVTHPAPSTHRPYIAPTGPGIDASLFDADDDETKLYIMTPVADGQEAGSTKYKYQERIKAIQNTIRRHIGRRPKYVSRGYKRLRSGDPRMNNSHRGMCLFQYDPNSDGNGRRAWRLFMEDAFRSHWL